MNTLFPKSRYCNTCVANNTTPCKHSNATQCHTDISNQCTGWLWLFLRPGESAAAHSECSVAELDMSRCFLSLQRCRGGYGCCNTFMKALLHTRRITHFLSFLSHFALSLMHTDTSTHFFACICFFFFIYIYVHFPFYCIVCVTYSASLKMCLCSLEVFFRDFM